MKEVERLNKRGASSHVEVILSFVMFFVFVTFLLFYIRPYGSMSLQGSIIPDLHDSFLEETERDLTRFFLNVGLGDGENCFRIDMEDLGFDWFEEGDGVFANVIVQGTDGLEEQTIPSEFDNGYLSVSSVYDNFYVYISSAFSSGDVVCGHELEGSNVSIGSVENEKIVFYDKLLELNESYHSEYSALKERFNVPETFDFAIVSEKVSMEMQIPEDVEVQVESYLVEVLEVVDELNQVKVEQVDFSFKVW